MQKFLGATENLISAHLITQVTVDVEGGRLVAVQVPLDPALPTTTMEREFWQEGVLLTLRCGEVHKISKVHNLNSLCPGHCILRVHALSTGRWLIS